MKIKDSQTFILTNDHVTLGQLLKLSGVIGSGGEAKLYLASSTVMVNGHIENRRGRKLRSGDIINTPGGLQITVVNHAILNGAVD